MASNGEYADVADVLARIQHVTEFLGVKLIDPNQRGIFGNTPLTVAVVWGDLDAARILLDAGAEVNAKVEDGQTPLHFAVEFGNLDIVRLLVGRGASLDLRDDDGHTPMAVAAIRGKQDMVDLLREIGSRRRNTGKHENSDSEPI
jgi:ankyrin repeat protein